MDLNDRIGGSGEKASDEQDQWHFIVMFGDTTKMKCQIREKYSSQKKAS